jgi:hypothetical protein
MTMLRLRADHGVSTLELGLVLPVVLMLLSIVVPVIDAGRQYIIASRVAAHGIRYATRVDTNPRVGPDGDLTRRPTSAEVSSSVTDAATEIDLVSVTTSPEPTSSLSGDLITVRVTYRTTFGPLASLANGVKQTFFGGGELLPDSKDITVTARGREE